MSESENIRLLTNHQLDYDKWEGCIGKASSGVLYVHGWYLDLVAEGWQALVFGDYEYVMPLPVKSRFGIKYVYQPTFCQQLGIYPNPPLEIQKLFAAFLRKRFRLISYQLSTENNVTAFEGYQSVQKVNYTMPLSFGVGARVDGFSNHARRNIAGARKNNVNIMKGLLPHTYLESKKLLLKKSPDEMAYQALTRLMANTVLSGKGVIYAAWSSDNSLCAAAFLIFDMNRIYYLNAFSTEEGRKNRAMYAIVDEIIKEFTGSGFILDFEGSVIEGVARFYKGFGAAPENYFYIYSNRLPFIRKFMK